MKLKTKEIRAAALEYQKNRKLLDERKDRATFDVMLKMAQAGLIELCKSGGTFSGRNPNSKSKPLFILNIGLDNIDIKQFKDTQEYLDYRLDKYAKI